MVERFKYNCPGDSCRRQLDGAEPLFSSHREENANRLPYPFLTLRSNNPAVKNQKIYDSSLEVNWP